MGDYIRHTTQWLGKWIPKFPSRTGTSTVVEVERAVVREIELAYLLRHGNIFIRLAGASGFLAVGLGAYGAHGN